MNNLFCTFDINNLKNLTNLEKKDYVKNIYYNNIFYFKKYLENNYHLKNKIYLSTNIFPEFNYVRTNNLINFEELEKECLLINKYNLDISIISKNMIEFGIKNEEIIYESLDNFNFLIYLSNCFNINNIYIKIGIYNNKKNKSEDFIEIFNNLISHIKKEKIIILKDYEFYNEKEIDNICKILKIKQEEY